MIKTFFTRGKTEKEDQLFWREIAENFQEIARLFDRSDMAASRYFLSVFATASHTITSAFGPATAIPFTNIIAGASFWDAATNEYIAPVAGYYRIDASVVATPSQTTGKGFGIDAQQAFARLVWAVISNNPPFNRTTLSYSRVLYLNKGERVSLLGFSDAAGGVNIDNRSLTIIFEGK